MTWLYKDIWCMSKYYEDDFFRIFSMTNFQENKLVFDQIEVRETDRFIILLTWMHSRRWFETAKGFIENRGLKINQFYFMCNTQTQLTDAKKIGLFGYLVNRHFVLHPGYYKTEETEKVYDVCVYGEQLSRNRFHLAFHLPRLAIVDAMGKTNPSWKYPKDAYRNTEYLHEDNLLIQKIMRQSYTGLCLARSESICQSSTEFLFNGIPVISSNDDTGRLEWFNSYNSIIIDSVDRDTISKAVAEMKQRVLDKAIDPNKIRNDAIALMKSYGREFRKMISDIFVEINQPDVSSILLKAKFEHHFLYQKHWKDLHAIVALFNG